MDKQTVKIVENAEIIDDPGQPPPETVSVGRLKTAKANGCPAYIRINGTWYRI
jgi:hypothetical protein